MPFTVDWFSHNIPVWETHLEKFKDSPTRAIEIGCFEGMASKWLLENVLNHPESELICIDTFEGSEEHTPDQTKSLEMRFWENVEQFQPKVTSIRGKSQEILRTYAITRDFAKFFKPYNLIYIDGSHQASDVLEDAILSFRILDVGGIMIFDDYEWQEYRDTLHHPKAGVDAFLNIFSGKVAVLHRGYQIIVEKL